MDFNVKHNNSKASVLTSKFDHLLDAESPPQTEAQTPSKQVKFEQVRLESHCTYIFI
jgi:hypothetical protein